MPLQTKKLPIKTEGDMLKEKEANKICFLSIKGHQIYELKYYITQEKEHGVTLKKKKKAAIQDIFNLFQLHSFKAMQFAQSELAAQAVRFLAALSG